MLHKDDSIIKMPELTEKGAMKDAGVKTEKVEISKRLTESPVAVVTSQLGDSAQQEKVMRAQAFQNKEQLNETMIPWDPGKDLASAINNFSIEDPFDQSDRDAHMMEMHAK